MLIRSQSKKDLVNIDNISDIYVEDNSIYCSYLDDIVRIGEYASESEAINVLDMIQEYYLQYYIVGNQPVVFEPKVFVMPEAQSPVDDEMV